MDYEKKLVVKKNNPDLFDFYQYGNLLIVSDKAKKVFEENDRQSHQYVILELVDKHGKPISDVPYYLMSVRRFVKISGEYPEMPIDKMFPQMSDFERKVRSALSNNSEIRSALADSPIWKLPIERSTVFMSTRMLQSLRDSGCTGLNDYKVDNRHKGAPVSYV